MNSNNIHHLDENQLIQAVVDASDLPITVQAHLAACRHCQNSKQSFERELTNLGQLARQFAPKPQRRISLPVQKTRSRFSNFRDWRSIIAAAATVAVVFVVVWGINIARNGSEHRTANRVAEMQAAKQLMTEVDMLVDNALPNFYLEISGEKNPDYDEEFYQFLIPLTREENLS